MRRSGEEVTAIGVKAVSLRGTRKARDSPSPHSLKHFWTRTCPLAERPQQTRCVVGTGRDLSVRGKRNSGLQTRNRAQASWRPGHRVRRRRAGEFVPSRGAPSAPNSNSAAIPRSRSRSTHSSLVKGDESCATVPVPNLTVPPAGRSAPQPPLTTLLRSPKERPLPCAGHTPGVANFCSSCGASWG